MGFVGEITTTSELLVNVDLDCREKGYSNSTPVFLVLPVKTHPFLSRRPLGDGEQAIEASTESADLLFVRIPFSYQDIRWAAKLHGGLRTNLFQPIPILVSK